MDRSNKSKTGRVYAAFVQHIYTSRELVGKYSCPEQDGVMAFFANHEFVADVTSREFWHKFVDSMPDAERDLLYDLLREYFGGDK